MYMALYYGLWGATGLPLEIEKSNLYKYKQNTKLKTIYGTGGLNKGWWKLSKEKKKKRCSPRKNVLFILQRPSLFFIVGFLMSICAVWLNTKAKHDRPSFSYRTYHSLLCYGLQLIFAFNLSNICSKRATLFLFVAHRTSLLAVVGS